MLESKLIDMGTLVESSEDLLVSMESFLDTEFKYIRYLRNRDKYFIGIKSVAATPLLMMEQSPPVKTGGGGGLIPPFRRWRRRSRVKQPAWDPAYERAPQRAPVRVPQTQTQTVPGTIPIPDLQPGTVPGGIPNAQPGTIPGGIPNVQPGTLPGGIPDGGGVIVNPGQQLVPEINIGGQVGSELGKIIESLTKQREEDTNEVRSGSLEKGGFIPEPAMAWQLLSGAQLLTRIEFEMSNGIGSAGLPETVYQRGSTHNIMVMNSLINAGLNVPPIINSIDTAMSATALETLRAEFPEPVKVSGGWSVWDVVQAIGTVILPFLDGPIPAGDAGALVSLANLMMKGKVSWGMIRPIISIFGDDAVNWVMNQLKNLGVTDDLFSMGARSVQASPVKMASGGLLTSPFRSNNILAGEAGPELVLPLSKVTDAIEAVYREGGSLMVGATQSFLANMNSPAARGVLSDANKISAILGSSPVEIASITIPDNILKSLPKIEKEKNVDKKEEKVKSDKIDSKDVLSFIEDPEKKAAIQMILKLEGTQGKTGFSRWFGDNPIDGAKYGDITGKTINEVHDLQTKFLKDPQSNFTDLEGNTNKSAAVGGGQFIYLKSDAVRLLGIDPSKQEFTPQFQVALIEAMARESGVDINEKLTIKDIKKLGKKWSSLTMENKQTTRSAQETFNEYLKILPVSENLKSLLIKPFQSLSKKNINDIPVELAKKNIIVELPIPIVIPLPGPTQMVPVETEVVVNRKLPLVVDTFGKGVRV